MPGSNPKARQLLRCFTFSLPFDSPWKGVSQSIHQWQKMTPHSSSSRVNASYPFQERRPTSQTPNGTCTQKPLKTLLGLCYMSFREGRNKPDRKEATSSRGKEAPSPLTTSHVQAVRGVETSSAVGPHLVLLHVAQMYPHHSFDAEVRKAAQDPRIRVRHAVKACDGESGSSVKKVGNNDKGGTSECARV